MPELNEFHKYIHLGANVSLRHENIPKFQNVEKNEKFDEDQTFS